MTKADELLSLSTRRRSGIVTLSASAWLSIPYGPSASVSQTISGPPSKPSGFKASSSPCVTTLVGIGIDDENAWAGTSWFPADDTVVECGETGITDEMEAIDYAISNA